MSRVGLICLIGVFGVFGVFGASAGPAASALPSLSLSLSLSPPPSPPPSPSLSPSSVTGAWPTDAPHLVLRPFEAPATRYSAGHRGIDIRAAPGQPVYAVVGGTVSFAGVVVDRPVVSISNGEGLLAAVEPVTPTVAKGDTVTRGQQIGVVASLSSHCELGCVHLGLRLHGDYVSPLILLGGVPRAVLLPVADVAG